MQCSWQPEGHMCFHGFLYLRHLLFPKGIRKDLISGHSVIDCDGHLLSERGLGVCRCDGNCSVTIAATSLAPHSFSWSAVVLSGKCRRMSLVYAAVGSRRAQTTAGVRRLAWSLFRMDKKDCCWSLGCKFGITDYFNVLWQFLKSACQCSTT